MIKDKIIELESGINYYVIEEISYNNKMYLLAAECDPEKDTVKEDNYIVMEVKLDNNELITTNIEDDNVAAIVTQKLLEKLKK